jgi:hypothetical protein
MIVTIDIPDGLRAPLQKQFGDLSRTALEALAVESYRTRTLSAFQIRQMLGHESRMATIDFLSAHGVYPNYTDESVAEDLATLDRVLGS